MLLMEVLCTMFCSSCVIGLNVSNINIMPRNVVLGNNFQL